MQRTGLVLRITAVTLIGVAAVFFAQTAQAQDTAPAPAPVTAPTPQAVPQAAPSADWMTFTDHYGGGAATTDLTQAHLANADIVDWTQQRVTDALTLSPDVLGTKFTTLRAGFTDAGWASYSRLLGELNVVDSVRNNGMAMSTIASGGTNASGTTPTASGHYRWHVILPVMHSYTANGSAGRADAKNVLAVSVVRASLPKAEVAGEIPLHEDLKIDDIRLMAQGLPAAAAPAAP